MYGFLEIQKKAEFKTRVHSRLTLMPISTHHPSKKRTNLTHEILTIGPATKNIIQIKKLKTTFVLYADSTIFSQAQIFLSECDDKYQLLSDPTKTFNLSLTGEFLLPHTCYTILFYTPHAMEKKIQLEQMEQEIIKKEQQQNQELENVKNMYNLKPTQEEFIHNNTFDPIFEIEQALPQAPSHQTEQDPIFLRENSLLHQKQQDLEQRAKLLSLRAQKLSITLQQAQTRQSIESLHQKFGSLHQSLLSCEEPYSEDQINLNPENQINLNPEDQINLNSENQINLNSENQINLNPENHGNKPTFDNSINSNENESSHTTGNSISTEEIISSTTMEENCNSSHTYNSSHFIEGYSSISHYEEDDDDDDPLTCDQSWVISTQDNLSLLLQLNDHLASPENCYSDPKFKPKMKKLRHLQAPFDPYSLKRQHTKELNHFEFIHEKFLKKKPRTRTYLEKNLVLHRPLTRSSSGTFKSSTEGSSSSERDEEEEDPFQCSMDTPPTLKAIDSCQSIPEYSKLISRVENVGSHRVIKDLLPFQKRLKVEKKKE